MTAKHTEAFCDRLIANGREIGTPSLEWDPACDLDQVEDALRERGFDLVEDEPGRFFAAEAWSMKTP